MTAGYIGNRHPRLHCFLHHRHLLLCGISAPALDPGKHFNSINTVRHSRNTRRMPSPYLRRLCPVQIGAAPKPMKRIIVCLAALRRIDRGR